MSRSSPSSSRVCCQCGALGAGAGGQSHSAVGPAARTTRRLRSAAARSNVEGPGSTGAKASTWRTTAPREQYSTYYCSEQPKIGRHALPETALAALQKKRTCCHHSPPVHWRADRNSIPNLPVATQAYRALLEKQSARHHVWVAATPTLSV